MSDFNSELSYKCKLTEVKFCFPPREMPELEIGVSLQKYGCAAFHFPNVMVDAFAIGDHKTLTIADRSAGAADHSEHIFLSFPVKGGPAIFTAVDPTKSPPSTLVMYGSCEVIE